MKHKKRNMRDYEKETVYPNRIRHELDRNNAEIKIHFYIHGLAAQRSK